MIRSAPAVIEVGGDPEASIHLDRDLISIHGEEPSAPTVASLEGGRIVVAPSTATAAPGERIGPVYRERGGGLAVPTGRIFVRFRREHAAKAHAEALAGAGFDLERVPAYAPHAVWVRPSGDEAFAALGNLDRLRSLPGVEHVEPQILTTSAHRDSEER